MRFEQDLPFWDPRTLAENQSAATFVQFIAATMLTAFGLLALSLATVGPYGVLAFVVNQRQREIAIRFAPGANSGQVKRLILKQGLLFVFIGLALGGAASLGVGRLLKSQLLGVSHVDPLTFGAGALLLLIALVACYTPARPKRKLIHSRRCAASRSDVRAR